MESWDNFKRRILINRPIEDIFKMWASSDGLTTWFLKVAEYADTDGNRRLPSEPYQAGDKYLWRWHNWDGSSEGKVLENNGKDYIKFEFANSIVEVKIEPFEDGRTLLSLIQSEIADDNETKMQVYCGCSCGWTFWLTNLKAYLEHGILLNEVGEELKGKFDGYQIVNT